MKTQIMAPLKREKNVAEFGIIEIKWSLNVFYENFEKLKFLKIVLTSDKACWYHKRAWCFQGNYANVSLLIMN